MTRDESKIEFDELADQFAAEIRTGKANPIEDYASRFPQHAEEIRRLFPVLQMMEAEAVAIADEDSEAGLLEAELEDLDAAISEQLGDYRIVREIGRGGMGLVFEAHQESLDRRVALKILPDSARFDARRRQRFQQEALAAAQLHHTNIVPVFGIGKHRETSYFVMQYIEGQTIDNVLTELSKIRSGQSHLSTHMNADSNTLAATIASNFSSVDFNPESPQVEISQAGRFESNGESKNGDVSSTIVDEGHNDRAFFRNIASIGIQVSDALVHAHSKNILHRDIKPSNLMIDKDRNAWVTDFGLAKSFESPDLTRSGEVVGTLRYMSPEQLNGQADARSDIFGLGLTLYELAALKPAYDGSDRNELMQQAIAASPKQLRSINANVPRDMETIIHKCIASEPDRRYNDAAELKSDLERFRRGEPILARRINPVQRFAKWCRRQPLIASLAAALVLTMLTGIAGVTWQWQKTESALELANTNLYAIKQEREKTADALNLANDNLAEANRQTEIAQSHFRQVRESVNKFFTVIGQQRLLQEPGLQGLRKELLQEAVNYHKDFVAQYKEDDSLKLELGQSIFFICNIAYSMNAGSDPAQIDEAIDIFRELNESAPDDPTNQLWLARSLASKGKLIRRRDSRGAMQLIESSANILEDLVAADPENVSAMDELATNYQSLGLSYESLERATQQAEQSVAYYSKAHSIREKILELLPEDVENAILYGDLHRDLAIAYRRNGDLEKARDYYFKAEEILRPIVEANPDHLAARKTLGSVANSIAYFYCHGGGPFIDFDIALQYYDLSRESYQVLADNNPLIFEFRDGLARTALGAGSIYQAQGKLQKAYDSRKLAADIREKLCQQNPQAFYLRSSWAMSLNGLGSTLRDMGKIEEAIEKHQLAHFEHKKAVEMDPQMPVLRMRLITGLLQLSRVQARAKKFEESLATIQQVDDFSLPEFSKPRFDKGAELTLLACKIAQQLREGNQAPEELIATCIEQAKTEFKAADQLQFNVPRSAMNHVSLPSFAKKHPEAESILNWIQDEFGE